MLFEESHHERNVLNPMLFEADWNFLIVVRLKLHPVENLQLILRKQGKLIELRLRMYWPGMGWRGMKNPEAKFNPRLQRCMKRVELWIPLAIPQSDSRKVVSRLSTQWNDP